MSENEKNKLPEEITPETTEVPPVVVVPNEGEGTGEKKKDKKGLNFRNVGKNMPVGPGNFWNNMLSTVLLLIFITAAFSY